MSAECSGVNNKDEEAQDKKSYILKPGVSHQDAVEFVNNTLGTLINNDALLKNIPIPLTVEEINSLIALEQKQAMIINVQRADGESLPVIVEQNAVVQDLKRAVRRYVTLKQVGRYPCISL